MNKIKIIQLNKNNKGVLFTAGAVALLTLLLVFSILLYRYTEENETRILSNSYSLRILAIEDSIQQSIMNVFLLKTNLSLSVTNITASGINYDRISIVTSLNTNSPKYNLALDFSRLKNTITISGLEVDFDNTTLTNNLYLEYYPGIGIYKNESTSLYGEQLIIYYNKSGLNNLITPNITIIINSSTAENVFWSDENKKITGGTGRNLTIIVDNERTPGYESRLSCTLENINDIYFINVTDQPPLGYSPTKLINISIDKEKITLIGLFYNHTISVNVDILQANISKRFYFVPEVLNVSIPWFDVKKRSRIEFYP